MNADFEQLNADVVAEFGDDEPVTHKPGQPDEAEVTVVRVDPATLNDDAAASAFLILFADPATSGFITQPDREDEFTVDGRSYHAFQVKQDQSGGLLIFLAKE